MPDKQNFDHKDIDKSKEKGRQMGSESSAGAKSQEDWQNNKTRPKTVIKKHGFAGNRDKSADKGTDNVAPVASNSYPQKNKR